MDQNELISFKQWFNDFCGSFKTPNRAETRNITLKEDHTRHVCSHAVMIAGDLGMSGKNLLLAETAALFHDIGRFPQYHQYRTFDDSVSVNHAALGVKVLLERNVLQGLPKQERNIIIKAVGLHNTLELPSGLDPEVLLAARIVRDADKLDIWRVAIEYYQQQEGDRADAVSLGLPDTPSYSKKVLNCLKRGEMVRKADMTTLNDFKLLQLSWIYDLNFAASFRLTADREYIAKLAGLLPPDKGIAEGVERVRSFVEARRNQG